MVPASLAFAGECGNRVQAFITYEDYDDNMNKEIGLTIYPVQNVNDMSGFEGMVVKSSEPKNLEVELERKYKGSSRTKSWQFLDSEIKDGYRATKDMKGFDFLTEGVDGNAIFVLRLKQGGKVVCEDKPREISAEGEESED